MTNNSFSRYGIIDSVRGFTIINMILYHALWDLVYIYNFNLPWFYSSSAHIWQQAICTTFIFLSGFCWPFSHHNLKRGLIVFLSGALVSIVTTVFMPQEKILFGVLTLIGSSMLIMIPCDKALKNKRPLIRFFICILLFVITKNLKNGYLYFGQLGNLYPPDYLYSNLFSSYFGFKAPWFKSSDYFPLMPWFFMFISGYFMNKVLRKNQLLKYLKGGKANVFSKIGRHSLIIYLLHQPLIYGILWVLDKVNII